MIMERDGDMLVPAANPPMSSAVAADGGKESCAFWGAAVAIDGTNMFLSWPAWHFKAKLKW